MLIYYYMKQSNFDEEPKFVMKPDSDALSFAPCPKIFPEEPYFALQPLVLPPPLS